MNIDKLKNQLVDEVLAEIKDDLKAQIKADIMSQFGGQAAPSPTTRKYLTQDEKNQILSHWWSGCHWNEIGAKVGRNPATVYGFLLREKLVERKAKMEAVE